MLHHTTIEIVAPNGSVLKNYAVALDGSLAAAEQSLLRAAYLRAEQEGLAPSVLDTCAFRLPRMVRKSGSREMGFRTHPAPRMRRHR